MPSWFVDYSGGDDANDGSIGSPLKTVQEAIDQHTTGDRINLRNNATHVLSSTLDFTTSGDPSLGGCSRFHGYAASEGDGGIATIQGSGSHSIVGTTPSLTFANLIMDGNGASNVCEAGNWRTYRSCAFHNCTSHAVGSGRLLWCYLHNIGGVGAINCNEVFHCYFDGSGTRDFGSIGAVYACDKVIRNFFNLTQGVAIYARSNDSDQCGNSVYSSAATGNLIELNVNRYDRAVFSNLLEGGNYAIRDSASSYTYTQFIGNNGSYGQNTDSIALQSTNENAFADWPNEEYGSSPYKKNGSLPTDFTDADFWNDLFAWFEPNNDDGRGAVAYQTGGGGGGPSGFPLGRVAA